MVFWLTPYTSLGENEIMDREQVNHPNGVFARLRFLTNVARSTVDGFKGRAEISPRNRGEYTWATRAAWLCTPALTMARFKWVRIVCTACITQLV
jgi:hypothetical protein